MESALKLKRNTLYRVIVDKHAGFPAGTIVKRCKWYRYPDGTKERGFFDDEYYVAMRKPGSRSYTDWSYFSFTDVEEVI